jgi:hypothetical protein
MTPHVLVLLLANVLLVGSQPDDLKVQSSLVGQFAWQTEDGAGTH